MNIGVNVILLVIAVSIPSVILLSQYLTRKKLRKKLEELNKKERTKEKEDFSEIKNRNPDIIEVTA